MQRSISSIRNKETRENPMHATTSHGDIVATVRSVGLTAPNPSARPSLSPYVMFLIQ